MKIRFVNILELAKFTLSEAVKSIKLHASKILDMEVELMKMSTCMVCYDICFKVIWQLS